MSNPIFLDIEQVMTILMGEMPEGLYATDRADHPDKNERSYSSSEIRAHAQLYANMYSNLQDIYQNKFISTLQADEVGRWEVDLFSSVQNAALPFATRQTNLLIKYRATGGISYPYIYNLIATLLTPEGLTFSLNAYCGGPLGAWILDVAPLDLETYLALEDPIYGALPGVYNLDCFAQIITSGTTTATSPVITAIPTGVTQHIQIGAGITGAGIPANTTILSKGANSVTMSQNATANNTAEHIEFQNYLAAGLTQEEFLNIQTTAYTYSVNIYGNASPTVINTLEALLTQSEPAGSTFQIFNNAAPPDDPNILDLGAGRMASLVDAIDCGTGLIGATYDVWDFSL